MTDGPASIRKIWEKLIKSLPVESRVRLELAMLIDTAGKSLNISNDCTPLIDECPHSPRSVAYSFASSQALAFLMDRDENFSFASPSEKQAATDRALGVLWKGAYDYLQTHGSPALVKNFASEMTEFASMSFSERAVLSIKNLIHEYELNLFFVGRPFNEIKNNTGNKSLTQLYDRLLGLVMGLKIADDANIDSMEGVRTEAERILPSLWSKAYEEFLHELSEARQKADKIATLELGRVG